MTQDTQFGIPRLSVLAEDGREIDLTAFQGHPLVLVCCQAEGSDVAAFLRDLAGHADRLAALDAWTVGITEQTVPEESAGELRMLVARDCDGSLHAALADHLRDAGGDLSGGAVFLFGRGGNLQRCWTGHPKAEEVVEELARRR